MIESDVTYIVRVHPEEGSFWAEVRELPGCFASGDSMDELWEALGEAISLYLSTPENVVLVRLTSVSPFNEDSAAESDDEYKVLVAC